MMLIQMLCFYGSNPDDPYNLNGELEIYIGDEAHILTRSTLIFVPAGVVHSRPLFNRIDQPIFHVSMVLSTEYHFVIDNGTSSEVR